MSDEIGTYSCQLDWLNYDLLKQFRPISATVMYVNDVFRLAISVKIDMICLVFSMAGSLTSTLTGQ